MKKENLSKIIVLLSLTIIIISITGTSGLSASKVERNIVGKIAPDPVAYLGLDFDKEKHLPLNKTNSVELLKIKNNLHKQLSINLKIKENHNTKPNLVSSNIYDKTLTPSGQEIIVKNIRCGEKTSTEKFNISIKTSNVAKITLSRTIKIHCVK